MITFVMGLPFTADGHELALIRKDKPAWMAGLLNGPGGHIEAGETPIEALLRELREECNIQEPVTSWREIARMSDSHALVHVFSCFSDGLKPTVRAMTREAVEWVEPTSPDLASRCVPGLARVIEHALQRPGAILDLPTNRPDKKTVPQWR